MSSYRLQADMCPQLMKEGLLVAYSSGLYWSCIFQPCLSMGLVWQCSRRALNCVGGVELSTRHPNSAFCGLCGGLRTKTWGFLFSLYELYMPDCVWAQQGHTLSFCAATIFLWRLAQHILQLLPGGNCVLAVKHWPNVRVQLYFKGKHLRNSTETGNPAILLWRRRGRNALKKYCFL